ncbi:MAG: hypothetical protein HUU20_29075, partial [Pirellulales bacterium]|nr:hypothetical protein [Pirellulales bacterium]
YRDGWGVLTADEKNPTAEHTVRDAVQKLAIAHDYADGVRIYGLGIDHDAYQAMAGPLQQWQSRGAAWGQKREDPESHLERWRRDLGEGPYLGTLLNFERGLGRDLPGASAWPRIEVLRDLAEGRFTPAEAARRYPLMLVSKGKMPRSWPGLLAGYARAGGTLFLEFLPGWQLDASAGPPSPGEKEAGDQGVLTLEFAKLSGIEFHYEPRGFATRWRVAKPHPLTEGLAPVGVWQETTFKPGQSTYEYLASPVKPAGAEVLIEVEHEQCPYDGIHYVRKGTVNGIYPLLTVNSVDQGTVVRHYAAVSPREVLADAYPRLMTNLVRHAESGPKAAR